MKIIYFGYNALSSCLDFLIQNDYEVLCVYTGENNEHTDQIFNLAEQASIKIVTSKPSLDELNKLVEQGANCFISAEYPHKIPVPESLSYAINIHPTLLPEGRGQTPLPLLILKYPEVAGITLHKISEQLDKGDILLQQSIALKNDESFDSLSTKVFIESPLLLQKLLANINDYYSHAKVQTEGSYWPTLTVEQQSIQWDKTVDEITLICRAFGSLGVKISINDSEYYITSSQCFEYTHNYGAGDVMLFDDFKLIIALSNGVIIIPRACLFEM